METQEQPNSTCKGLAVRRVWLVLGPREEQQEICRPQRVQEKMQGPLMGFSWLFWGKTGIHWGKASLKVGETSEGFWDGLNSSTGPCFPAFHGQGEFHNKGWGVPLTPLS